MSQKVIIIGSGMGGLATAIRLQASGYQVKILEKLDKPGGRAYQDIVKIPEIAGEFKFDLGPTVLTAPFLYEELFALNSTKNQISENIPFNLIPRYPEQIFDIKQIDLTNTQKYCQITPIFPFYRIYFDDGSTFDYDGNLENTKKQIEILAGIEEVKNYEKFLINAFEVFQEGFIKLGFNHFSSVADMIKILPKLLKLDVIQPLYKYVEKYFTHPKMKKIFSFESLLIGGNPLTVLALYTMIHFVEKTWGVYYAIGGTGSLINGLVKKFQELGGEIIYNQEVVEIVAKNRKIEKIITKDNNYTADILVSNADYYHTYSLIKSPKIINNKLKITKLTKYSNSLFILYFAFKKEKNNDLGDSLRHHNIILGKNYQEELENIYQKGETSDSFSQYLHLPSLTDPNICPPNYHLAYTLVCIPNTQLLDKTNDNNFEQEFSQKIINSLDNDRFIPNLKERLIYTKVRSQKYFRDNLNSYLANSFGVSPIFRQSAYFRPHNKSLDFDNLYLVGASYQPGAGTPSVLMSAKMTVNLIFK